MRSYGEYEYITRHLDVMERPGVGIGQTLIHLWTSAPIFSDVGHLECRLLGRVLAEVIAVSPVASVLTCLLSSPLSPWCSEGDLGSGSLPGSAPLQGMVEDDFLPPSIR